MYNFRIVFSYPWLLLLLIPAIAFTLLPYFRLSKKYRRTRNRIASIVLHLTALTLAIFALSGLHFDYTVPNDKNELVLLVDVSQSEEESAQKRDNLVETILHDSQFDGYKVGVVTFGFDQEYAVPLTYEVEGAFDSYLAAPLPDVSATNVADALRYAKDLFEYPQTAKIILISDGKETDDEALNAIRSIVSQGTKVDTAYVPSVYDGTEVQITGVGLPKYHVSTNKQCVIDVTLSSNAQMYATVELSDNGVVDQTTGVQSVVLSNMQQTISFKHVFTTDELHELSFKVTVNKDGLTHNNVYTSYLYIEEYTKILIVERTQGLSTQFVSELNAEQYFDITTKTITSEDLPMTVEELQVYDQVIFNNVGGLDLKSRPGFVEALEKYVRECGGGLFTLGGNKEDGKTANAYNRSELYGTTYQKMLPVEAINYTPPIAVMIIIDRSGSMGDNGSGDSYLEWAKAGAVSCLEALSERDYVGIMTLDSKYDVVLGLTPKTKKEEIEAAINSIDTAEGATQPAASIERAGFLLSAQEVDKRHIIMVTDGQVPTAEHERAKTNIEENYKNAGITFSVVAVGVTEGTSTFTSMKTLTDAGHGSTIAAEGSELVTAMYNELKQDAIRETNEDEPFYPIVPDITSPLVQGLTTVRDEKGNHQLNVQLGGFYGVKARANADVLLQGPFGVPLYAQWKYGKGTVGSFMSDLNGVWTGDFMKREYAGGFVEQVVKNLMPTENIRPNDISVNLTQDNYLRAMSVYTELDTSKGEYIKGEIAYLSEKNVLPVSLNEVTSLTEDSFYYVRTALTAENNYSHCKFVIKRAGVYKITLVKYAADGTELEKYETYQSFSYSEEYDAFGQAKVPPKELMETLANRGGGMAVEDLNDPWEVFEGFVTELERTYDPRIIAMILVIVLFLLDVAVRKFKFKWPHELIRDYKAKKEESEKINSQKK